MPDSGIQSILVHRFADRRFDGAVLRDRVLLFGIPFHDAIADGGMLQPFLGRNRVAAAVVVHELADDERRGRDGGRCGVGRPGRGARRGEGGHDRREDLELGARGLNASCTPGVSAREAQAYCEGIAAVIAPTILCPLHGATASRNSREPWDLPAHRRGTNRA